MLEKHRIIVRVTRKRLEENMSAGPIRSAITQALNLDIYDTVECPFVFKPDNGDLLITFLYIGNDEHTLPRYCVELISRYDTE